MCMTCRKALGEHVGRVMDRESHHGNHQLVQGLGPLGTRGVTGHEAQPCRLLPIGDARPLSAEFVAVKILKAVETELGEVDEERPAQESATDLRVHVEPIGSRRVALDDHRQTAKDVSPPTASV